MTALPRILLVGTADTKSDELLYLRDRLLSLGAQVVVMDVGVLEPAQFVPEITNSQVAAAAGQKLAALIEQGDENAAMIAMAQGASVLTAQMVAKHELDGLLVLGGSMGTDLALDVASVLPLGFPKVVLSTIAHSHLIAPERTVPDLVMMLWPGGLYGLNSLCKAALSQAAGAVYGACIAVEKPSLQRPLIGMTSFGKSCLRYMVRLKPALEARGFEVAVFHTTGMGGRAFESLAAQKQFAAVFDFSLQEISNHFGGSCVTAGPDRLTAAGLADIPQLVAPGAIDMIDFPAWRPAPDGFQNRPSHQHNRLIASATLTAEQRCEVASIIHERLQKANGKTTLLLPMKGLHAWDTSEGPLYEPAALNAFLSAMQQHAKSSAARYDTLVIDAHINDDAFCDRALEIFDRWVADGTIKKTTTT